MAKPSSPCWLSLLVPTLGYPVAIYPSSQLLLFNSLTWRPSEVGAARELALIPGS